jgi:hypothetical protein
MKIIDGIQDRCENTNNCLSSGIDRLLFPYALLVFGFDEWICNAFTGVLYSNHLRSLDCTFTNHVFVYGVDSPKVQEQCLSASCKANTREPVGPSVRQQQLQNCYKRNKNLPIAVSNTYYSYVLMT